MPRVEVLTTLPELGEDDVLAVPVGSGAALPAWLTGPGAPVDAALLAGALRDTGNTGRPGAVTNVPVPGRRPRSVVAVGVGDATLPELRHCVGVAVRRAQTLAEHGARRLVLPVDDAAAPAGAEEVRVAVETALLAGYRFRDTSAPHPPRLATVTVVATDAGDPAAVAAARAGEVAGRSVAWARDLVNTPSNTKDPAWLAAEAGERLAGLDHVTVHVLDADDLRAGGFGGVLAVGGGSATPPCVIVASYRPPGAAAGHHPVLVGKGITFDTGGISIKPTAGMREMKTDMAGGAAVLAAVDAAARLALPVAVTAVVPAAENAVSGSSYRPSDVVRHVGGRTTEVLNTDAEGRMVLADGLAHARLHLGATVLVDVATLTGAMKVALGTRTAGLYATSDGLADALRAAAGHAGEPVWRMPLAEEHADLLESAVADANNAPGNPGGTTAALFLRPFAGELPWAHLDVAGPARAGSDDAEVVKGGTGYGARTLLRWLEAGAPVDAPMTVD
ncbi:leucyl aminopeptidase family protein [Geodermatophilus sabuli]|uniref:Probable cytosol aminopeptidase n=1 Tax=Geodermatophilus sabuli TaxID=1564158 RepID=A0A285EG78_9ACTN|nr:leucyl aminopeptidase family protein [Geodermatophilus sabuli]MBB3083003.1 leucyl aminopeptidase [Geodermatophilus sabuli]SNX98000.1 leucyl aminopeptidase [Geodermatophilus sabuli]